MKTIALIPARYKSHRFPGKLMQDLGGKSVIKTTHDTVLKTALFDEVWVVTDSEIIFKEITDHGGRAYLSKKYHDCGSDRIAEAAADLKGDLIVNVQGDEPFIDGKSLAELIAVFRNDTAGMIDLASLMTPIKSSEVIENKDEVKVIVDLKNFALYFSRLPIPYDRDSNNTPSYYKHLGVYAFRREALIAFSEHPITPLEAAEKVECIRFLEMGRKIKMIETPHDSVGIDTVFDLEDARNILINSKA